MKKILSTMTLVLVLHILFAAGAQAVQVSDGNDSAIQASLRTIDSNAAVTSMDENIFLFGLTPGTLASDVTATGCTVTASDDSAVAGAAKIATGMKVQKSSESAQVVLIGDVNSDGDTNSADLAGMKISLLFDSAVSDSVAKAGDIQQDGVFDILDLVAFKKSVVSSGAVSQKLVILNYGSVSNDGWSEFK